MGITESASLYYTFCKLEWFRIKGFCIYIVELVYVLKKIQVYARGESNFSFYLRT